MTKEDFEEILKQEEIADILTDETYNESYSHTIHLTTNEIRQIANLLDALVIAQKPETIELAKNVIKHFNYEYGYKYEDVLFVKRLKNDGFSEVGIAKIINNIEDICTHCYNDKSGCQCWNDD